MGTNEAPWIENQFSSRLADMRALRMPFRAILFAPEDRSAPMPKHTLLYSCRSETMGSTREALKAGTQVAIRATPASAAAAETSVTGSCAFTP